jgi:hypothetical protein
MSVQVKHSLPRLGIGIENRTIPRVCNFLRTRNLRRHQENLTQLLGVTCVIERRYMLTRDHKNMNGRLRVDIPEGHTMFVLRDQRRRNLFPNDFAE